MRVRAAFALSKDKHHPPIKKSIHQVLTGVAAPAGLVAIAHKMDLQVGLVGIIYKIDFLVGLIGVVGEKPQSVVRPRLVAVLHAENVEVCLVLITDHMHLDIGLIRIVHREDQLSGRIAAADR